LIILGPVILVLYSIVSWGLLSPYNPWEAPGVKDLNEIGNEDTAKIRKQKGVEKRVVQYKKRWLMQ